MFNDCPSGQGFLKMKLPFNLFLQLNDYSLVHFLPLDISEEESIGELLLYIDNSIQYGEDLDVKVPRVCTTQTVAMVIIMIMQETDLDED